MPYVFVMGSLKISMVGVTKVNTIKRSAIAHNITNAILSLLHFALLLMNSLVSKINVMATEIKKMPTLNQSGDLPIAPLEV